MSVLERKILPSYAFGPFVLNGTERLLMRGDEVVPLTPKVLETLFVLVENRGKVLTKAVLMEALWPDAFVEESSLVQSISLLRKALGNGQADQIYIETLAKRGYRFVAEVREVNPDSAEVQSTNGAISTSASAKPDRPRAAPPGFIRAWPRFAVVRNWKTITALCCALAISVGAVYWWKVRAVQRQQGFDLRSVAVLPFKTIGAEGETDLLALGMADSVILKLTRLEAISVLPTSSVFKYLSAEHDALSIGADLGVDAVLDGTVQRSGDRVRVTAQLITLKDGKTIWSGTFDEQYSNIFCLQDSVSGLFADEVRLQVLNLQAKAQSKPITQDAEAYQAYLMGLYFWNKRTPDTLPKAIEYLQQAVEKDPAFATAYSLMADCYQIYAGMLNSDKAASATAMEKAETAAVRAIQLDETLAEAHLVLGGLLANKGDGDGAAKEYRRSLLLNPKNALAHVNYAYFLFVRQELDRAVSEARQAQELDPTSPITNAALGYMLMMNRQFESSIPYLDRAVELNPQSISSRINLGLAQLHRGRYSEAEAEFARLASRDPVSSQMNLALTYAKLGRRNDAHKLIGDLARSARRDQVRNYDLATIYVALGEHERAFEIFRKSTFSWLEKGRLRFDPELDNVRSEPKFEALFREQYPTEG